MNNKSIIVLNCFSRGGSNILWNVFLSHPEVCSPIKETLELFRINPLKSPSLDGYKFCLLSKKINYFNQWNLNERAAIDLKSKEFIDKVLYKNKLQTFYDDEIKYKSETEIYNLNEIEDSRLVIKNNNGLVFLSDFFSNTFEKCHFFSLVRSPYSLYEGHKRRNLTKGIKEFAVFYNKIIEKFIHDKNNLPNYHILQFEDLIYNPKEIINHLYKQADLNMISRFRFKAKKLMDDEGNYSTKFSFNRHHWFDLDNLNQILNPNVNSNQDKFLRNDEIKLLYKLTKDRLRELNIDYLIN